MRNMAARSTTGRSTQQCLDTRQQLGKIEGLCQVIIGARLELHHFIANAISGGEHQDRKSGMRLADAPQQFPTAQLREHQVKDEEIVAVRVYIDFAFATVRCKIDRESLGAQTANDKISKIAIVFDNEYLHSDYLISAFHSAPIKVSWDLH
jgi:hypothetical protein